MDKINERLRLKRNVGTLPAILKRKLEKASINYLSEKLTSVI